VQWIKCIFCKEDVFEWKEGLLISFLGVEDREALGSIEVHMVMEI